jgi:hypothetical protein
MTESRSFHGGEVVRHGRLDRGLGVLAEREDSGWRVAWSGGKYGLPVSEHEVVEDLVFVRWPRG